MRVVVIGATRGLGLALTKMLLAEGHTVVAGIRAHEVPKTLHVLLTQYGDKLMVKHARKSAKAAFQAMKGI